MNCVGTPDTRYLAGPDFIATVLHCVTAVGAPILSYGTFCILFKTPKTMAPVRYQMLNLHFWSCLSDLMISFIGVPYILLPAPAGYGLGVIHLYMSMGYFTVTCLAALAVAVLVIYENRYYHLFGDVTRWRKFRKPYLVVMLTTAPLLFVPPYFFIPDQKTAKEIVLSTIPCQPPFTFSDREMFVLALKLDIPFGSIGVGTAIYGISIVVFSVLIFWNLLKSAMTSKLSPHTLHIQKKFAIALTLQTTFLFTIVLAPVLVFLWILANSHHDQALNNFVFIVLSIHGVGDTIVMIFVHKPYREFTFSLFGCCFPKCKKYHDDRKSSPASIIV